MDDSIISVTHDAVEHSEQRHLPAAVNLAGDPAAQEALVRRILPHDVRDEVLAQLQAEEHHLTPLQWMLTVLVLVVAAFVVWRYLPEPVTPVTLGPVVEIETPDLPKNSRYHELDLRSKALFEQKHFAECAETMSRHIPDIIADPEVKTYARLLQRYFSAVRLGKVNDSVKTTACRYSRKAAKLFPDEPKWLILSTELNQEQFLNVNQVYAWLRAGRYSDIVCVQHVADIIQALKSLENLGEALELQARLKDAPAEAQENLVQLKVLQARLLVSLWMFHGGRGTADFPDDADDPGVCYREQALRICLEEENPMTVLGRSQACHAEFLQLRKVIAEIILMGHHLGNSYFWNASSHWDSSVLKTEISTVEKRLGQFAAKEAR